MCTFQSLLLIPRGQTGQAVTLSSANVCINHLILELFPGAQDQPRNHAPTASQAVTHKSKLSDNFEHLRNEAVNTILYFRRICFKNVYY